MLTLVNFFRTLLIAAVCLVLGACTQSTTSSYSGKVGSKSSIEKSRQAKILASRKRAKALKEARIKAFQKKRSHKRFANARTSSSKSRTRASRYNKKRSYKKRTRVSSKSASRKHSKRKRVSRKKSNRRVASKRKSKSNIKRVKKSSYAYVGGKSKGIRRNFKPWKCVPDRLKKVLRQISKKYGRVTINSTHRSKRHNRRVGGKRRSYHLKCQAVDFRVHGRTRGLTRWLANHPLVGGYNRYPSGYFHIDTGPKRTW